MRMNAAIAPEIPATVVKAEVDALGEDERLVESGPLKLYCTHARKIPCTLQELGRLREIAFRAVGEGTGKSSDIDLYDAYYMHLFAWDARNEVVVGAYRLGLTDQILARYGKRGLYTQTLFKYGGALLEVLNPAIELGRSFVRVEYQRDFAPLLLLWRGIGEFVVRSPRYAVLFGAVSISNAYEQASRELIVSYLTASRIEPELARHVQPRRPLRSARNVPPTAAEVRHLENIADLSRLVADIERDHKGVPVLLRQYLKCGGRLLGFSLDERFAGVLDALIMADLRNADPRILARYMGGAGAATFLAHHAATARRSPRPH
jgi:putative hemolysin